MGCREEGKGRCPAMAGVGTLTGTEILGDSQRSVNDPRGQMI